MKVNFRNRKVQLHVNKNAEHLATQHKQPLSREGLTREKSGSNLNPYSVVPSKSYANTAEKLSLDQSRNNYIQSIADTIHLIGQQYINYLNEGKEERFKATILSSLTKVDARDRKILYPYSFKLNSQGQIEFDLQRQRNQLTEWLGQMHFKVVSTSFDFFVNKFLTYEEVKVFCSENLLLNIIEFLNKLKNTDTTQITKLINETLDKNISYLLVKYPQAKQMKPNKRLRAQIQSINNLQNDQNDMLLHSEVNFTLKDSDDYNSQIMMFLNYLIKSMSQEVTIQGQTYTCAEGFYQIMEELFQAVYLPESQQNILQTKYPRDQFPNRRECMKKQMNQMIQESKQLKQYKEKVSHYTSYKIGQKISPNTELFSQNDIKAGFFQIKSTAILRILTKWIEQLQKKIKEARQFILKRSFRFKNNSKKFSKLNATQKNDLYIEAVKQVNQLNTYIKQIQKNSFEIEGKLATSIDRGVQHRNIPKNQYLVGEFCSKLQDAAGSSLISYLNKIIHILLTIPQNIKEKYVHDENLLNQMDINLITFKIGDILRCKCSSHESQILRIYKSIKNISEKDGIFKIIRIKDRLQMGTRDILINVLYNNTFLCEIQLAVTDQIDKKQQAYDAFNHYLYELKRSNLGPVMQSACIWAHFDQRSRVFKKIKDKGNDSHSVCVFVRHYCDSKLGVNDLPFVCSLCHKFYFSHKGLIKHLKCFKCNQYYECSNCIQNKMNEAKLKSFLGLQSILQVFLDDFVQWKEGNFPHFGLIIPKKSKNIQVIFFSTIIWKEDAYIVKTLQTKNQNYQTFQKKIEIIAIVERNQKYEWINLRKSYFIYEWTQKRNFNKTLKPVSILNELKKERQKIQNLQKARRQEKQQRKKQIKQKWKTAYEKKTKKKQGQQSRPSSQHSQHSEKSGVSSSNNMQMTNIKKKEGDFQKKQKKGHMKVMQKVLPLIDQKQKRYLEQICKKSEFNEVRIAQKKTDDGEYYLILGPYFRESEIRNQIKKRKNGELVKQNFQRKMQVLFLEDQLLKYQLNMDQKTRQNFLNSLKIIKQIYLDVNFLEDMQFVKYMPNLRVIHLNFNFIRDMDPIGQLKLLTELMLMYNKIEKIEKLQGKKHLIQINLNHNEISQIQNMQDLINLEHFSISDNVIQKIQGLSNLYNLIKLDLSYNRICKMEGLQNLQKLQELDLSYNLILQIQNLQNCENLKKLFLNRNFISKIQGLEKCINLKILQLHNNSITVLQNLENLGFLTNLILSNNNIKKIQGLTNKAFLLQLILSDNEIVNIDDLMEFQSSLVKLNRLDLSGNGIKNLKTEVFQFLPKLRYLYISSNPFKHTPELRKAAKKLGDKYQGFFLKLDDQITKDGSEFQDFQGDKISMPSFLNQMQQIEKGAEIQKQQLISNLRANRKSQGNIRNGTDSIMENLNESSNANQHSRNMNNMEILNQS